MLYVIGHTIIVQYTGVAVDISLGVSFTIYMHMDPRNYIYHI